MHCLLVEATFLTVHPEDMCDNLPKLHDFTLHRLLVEAKFVRYMCCMLGVGDTKMMFCERQSTRSLTTEHNGIARNNTE